MRPMGSLVSCADALGRVSAGLAGPAVGPGNQVYPDDPTISRDVALACAALSFCERFGASGSSGYDAKATKACIQVFSRLFSCVTLTESRLAATSS